MVSVILPNYNHEKFLEERIESILNQTYQDFELILLDDASTDNSISILRKYVTHPKVTVHLFNDSNSGSPFLQWEKGLSRASGDYIWIAESDDWSEPEFLGTAISELEKYNDMAIFYCQSVILNAENGARTSNKTWTDDLNEELWQERFYMDGNRFISEYMNRKNAIPNASAVVFRKNLVESSWFKELVNFRMAGDWLFWIFLCLKGRVCFSPNAYNYFRYSDQSTRNHDSYEKKRRRILEEIHVFKSLKNKISLYRKERNRVLIARWLKLHTKYQKFPLNRGSWIVINLDASFFMKSLVTKYRNRIAVKWS